MKFGNMIENVTTAHVKIIPKLTLSPSLLTSLYEGLTLDLETLCYIIKGHEGVNQYRKTIKYIGKIMQSTWTL